MVARHVFEANALPQLERELCPSAPPDLRPRRASRTSSHGERRRDVPAIEVGTLSPKSINNLRGYIQSIFKCAKRAGQFTGPNPVNDVRKRKVPKRKPRFLEAHEALRVLDALAPR